MCFRRAKNVGVLVNEGTIKKRFEFIHLNLKDYRFYLSFEKILYKFSIESMDFN